MPKAYVVTVDGSDTWFPTRHAAKDFADTHGAEFDRHDIPSEKAILLNWLNERYGSGHMVAVDPVEEPSN